jgi:Flp pilus assembly pilin Flp
MLRTLWNDRKGSTAIEYAVIASVVSVAAIASFLLLGGQTSKQMTDVEAAYEKAN